MSMARGFEFRVGAFAWGFPPILWGPRTSGVRVSWRSGVVGGLVRVQESPLPCPQEPGRSLFFLRVKVLFDAIVLFWTRFRLRLQPRYLLACERTADACPLPRWMSFYCPLCGLNMLHSLIRGFCCIAKSLLHLSVPISYCRCSILSKIHINLILMRDKLQ